MNPIIYFRKSSMEEGELEAAMASFPCFQSRLDANPGDLVVARYSALPFYRELYQDVKRRGALLVNSPTEHDFVADIRNYYALLGPEKLTPETWTELHQVPRDAGPFVLKGITNSKKQDWARSMYAETWKDAVEVHGRLQNDNLIGEQPIVIRKYVPLARLGTAIGGLPLTKEFRFFVCRGKVLTGGFYWHAFEGDVTAEGHEIPLVSSVPKTFLKRVVKLIGSHVPFYAVDVAETASGDWIVIELNDGQMSGLSANDPKVLYRRLYQVLATE